MIVIDTAALSFSLAASHTTAPGQMYVAYRDITPSSPLYVPKSETATSNGSTPVNLISVPTAGTYSLIDFISYFNSDTGNQIITISVGSTAINRVVLGVGERLEYAEGKGWTVFMNNGAAKQTYTNGTSPVSSSMQMTILNADVVNNNATANTIADVTGLAFAVNAGASYYFKFVVKYTAAATTTGSRWSISGPLSPTQLIYKSSYSLTSSTRTLNEGLAAYDLPTASNATSAATNSNIAEVSGFITPSANGTVNLRFASEIANSAITARTGSYVEWVQLQ